ncbi:MAG TPA: EAL domain-containing protein [Gemmataceae bacterium]|nr:EAL domain-containing protein [Gemmataceae bacterium]
MVPYLEHYPDPGGQPQRIVLDCFPFQIGRSEKAHFVLFARQVSKEHAEVRRFGVDQFTVHDLGSTNGTFVNGRRIRESPLINGDILHVAHKEFRFGYKPAGTPDSATTLGTECGAEVLPMSILLTSKYLREMLAQQLVSTVFQPIVALDDLALLGYECLGRGVHSQLTANPSELLALAEKCQLAADLSRSFRLAGVKEAARLNGRPRVFFNLHPTEMVNDRLLNSLGEAVAILGGGQRMVMEVHENIAADTATLRMLSQRLRQLGIGLAYDDFGAGQARLAELTEAPPDFVKLDMKLIRGIEHSKPKQEIVQSLGRVCSGLGVQIIAEGIETEDEASTCRQLGCRFGQGYFFGRPQPAGGLLARKASDTRRLPRIPSDNSPTPPSGLIEPTKRESGL